jgi:hypothetical protein
MATRKTRESVLPPGTKSATLSRKPPARILASNIQYSINKILKFSSRSRPHAHASRTHALHLMTISAYIASDLSVLTDRDMC